MDESEVGSRKPEVTGPAVGAAPASPAAAANVAPQHPSTPAPIDLGPRGEVIVVADGSALARAAAERFAQAVERAVAERGQAFVALSGGSTPKQMGGILAREPYRSRIPWEKVQVFWGDERWVPLGSPESNAGEAMRGFLDLVSIPRANIHPWDTEAETPRDAAAAYEARLREVFADPAGIPRFDLILLGMGDDGHTASLFPGTRALAAAEPLAVANYVPKLDAERLTLSAPVLNNGREILFLVGGPGKADAVEAVLDGPETPIDQPAQRAVRLGGADHLRRQIDGRFGAVQHRPTGRHAALADRRGRGRAAQSPGRLRWTWPSASIGSPSSPPIWCIPA